MISVISAALIGNYLLKWVQRKQPVSANRQSICNDHLQRSTSFIIQKTLSASPQMSQKNDENQANICVDSHPPELNSADVQHEAMQIDDKATHSESESYPIWDGLGPFGDNILFI